MTTTATPRKTELDQWKDAVENSRRTIQWLEKRNDQKTARIRALEARLRDMEGTR